MSSPSTVFHHIQGSGVAMSRNNALSNHAPSRNCYAGRNVMHHVLEFAFNIKFTLNSIITENTMYRVRKSDTTFYGAGVSIDNDDHCNGAGNGEGNQSGYYYSDNVWVIFNHIYDVQAGVVTSQQIHCGGGLCCYPGARDGTTDCCSGVAPEPSYEPSRVYVVGNIFDHIQPFGQIQAENFGIAVLIGSQVQARVVNNTIDECALGVRINGTHNTGECPPDGDTNGVIGITRNTSVAVINNIFLDTIGNGAHVKTDTGPNTGDLNQPAVLAEFDFDLHYPPETLVVKLPNGFNCFDLPCVRGYYNTLHPLDYADESEEFLDPHLFNPRLLNFRATSSSNFGQLGKPNDIAYNDFETAFGRSIYHDYDGNLYTPTTCSFGAFADPDL